MLKRKRTKKLGRNTKTRKALFRSLVVSLVKQGEIVTTSAKAKAVRPILEKLINKGKSGTLHGRRIVASFVQDKEVVSKLVDEISKRFSDKKSGYLKIEPLGNRKGDGAPIVSLSLVGGKGKKDEIQAKKPEDKPEKGKKTSLRLSRKPKLAIEKLKESEVMHTQTSVLPKITRQKQGER